jgi:hypothetical protein
MRGLPAFISSPEDDSRPQSNAEVLTAQFDAFATGAGTYTFREYQRPGATAALRAWAYAHDRHVETFDLRPKAWCIAHEVRIGDVTIVVNEYVAPTDSQAAELGL